MSTKAMRQALLLLGDYAATAPHPRVAAGTLAAIKDAEAELDRIEAAAKAMSDEDVTPEQVREANATLESIARETP